MDAGQEAPGPLQHLEVVQLGRTASAPGADREIKARVAVQRGAFQHQRGHGGHFGGRQLGAEGVLLQDLIAAPAARAVELEHDAIAVLQYRSEEHTSELQSPCNLVCRLLLEKK